MMTDTTIYGYYSDGGAVCSSCYDPERDGRPGEEGVYPLYYLEDDGNGLSCDECCEYIFEPYLDSYGAVRDGWEISPSFYGKLDDLADYTGEARFGDGDVLPVRTVNVETNYGFAIAAIAAGKVIAVASTPECSHESPDDVEVDDLIDA